MTDHLYLAFVLFFLIATLYSSIGHAGASGYLAIMALLSFSQDAVKPTSLILNIVVAAIASFKFIRAGYFDKRLFFAFVCTSLPMAYLGGYLTVDPKYFKLMAGVFLVLSALILVVRQYITNTNKESKPMPLPYGLALGSVIGLVSGLIGVGGGIFLSPILILANWTTAKKASGIAALFILCNSISGLAGHFTAIKHVDGNIGYWIVAVLAGGWIGSYLGTKQFGNKAIVFCLALVLVSAGIKYFVI